MGALLFSTAEDAIFEPNEIAIAVGDPAQLIIVVEGEVSVHKNIECYVDGDSAFCQAGGSDLMPMMPNLDPRSGAERVLTEGMGYGEEPEMRDGLPMSRFVVAVNRVRLHRLTHKAVIRTLGEPLHDAARRNEIKSVLSDIFLFKNLREEQIEKTIRRLEQVQFSAGELIVRQGDPAKHFFLIQSGTLCVQKDTTVLRTLGKWDYFGERGLLNEELRSASCQAMEEVVCLVLDKNSFFEIVGNFRKELERRMQLQDLNITMADLNNVAVVGRGTFGTVRLVSPKNNSQVQYALKQVKKMHVVKTNQEKSIVMEREVNAQCFHPCIVQFIKTFQDVHSVYFLTEFLGGGDLFQAIRTIGMLTPSHTQYFTGSITLALAFLHGRGIMYRDLKPENVLLDFQGYSKLVDFGCCKQAVSTSTLIGTPEYIAPEVIKGRGYTCSVDWWSLGVMAYEFIVGPQPFGANTEDQMKLFQEILEAPLVIPDYVKDQSAISLVQGLLERDGSERLAAQEGASEIKEHDYFDGFDWDALAGGFYQPPWKPDADEIRASWEPSDGDLMQHVGKGTIKETKGMEWCKGF